MAEDLTNTLLLKRNTKKKSGYSVAEEGGGYVLESTPSKARVRSGDRVVRINGIPAEEFLGEEDANGLIESIRIVVIPKEKLDEYDDLNKGRGMVDSETDEEDYEEYDRSHVPKVKKNNNGIRCDSCNHENVDLVPDEDGDLVCEECGNVLNPPSSPNPADSGVVYKCGHCNFLNYDLEPDEDGDLVCEGKFNVELLLPNEIVSVIYTNQKFSQNCEKECGHVMEPDVIHYCERCDYENKNLERDEEGDFVCEQCGSVIPEDNGKKAGDNEKSTDIVYDCPDCDFKLINPEPDEEGDIVCTECGCICPEKQIVECDVCQHKNVEPEKDNGEYFCQNCGSAIDVPKDYRKTQAERLREIDEEASDSDSHSADGEQFDENGTPITAPTGKKLTPADMFNPGDVITVTVGKSNPKQDPGLKVEEINGKYYVRKVPSGGLFSKTPVIAGDKLLELNGIDSHEFKHVNELKKILKKEQKITVVVLRRDPDASESSASSVDYDELKAVRPPTSKEEEPEDAGERTAPETEDDDTCAYDGENCGCDWCPACRELEECR